MINHTFLCRTSLLFLSNSPFRPQPWMKNRITFSIRNTTIESIVDIAVWDMTRILPSLVLIGNVEVKEPRNDWSYPQFLGKIITQGVNNYAAKLVDPDGFYR